MKRPSLHFLFGLFLTALPLLSVGLASCEDRMPEIDAEDIPYTGIPQVYITTPDGAEIERSNKENTEFRLAESPAVAPFTAMARVKGRGNSSWLHPKKPYSIEFYQPLSLFGMTEGYSWVLLANFKDPSLIRNDIAFYMAEMLGNFDFVPHFSFVDLSLNGLYRGIYQMGESIDIGPGRLGDGAEGFLLEIDGKARYHEVTFNTLRLYHPINIHYPEVVEGDDNFNYIKSQVQQAEDALYAWNFTDPEEGYRKYIDVESFVDWYLVNEISKNADAEFYTSCYLHLIKGEKLKMGPVWDFDLAFGGYLYDDLGRKVNDPTGFYIKNSTWYIRLFEDPAFVELVRERFENYYNRRQLIYDRIDYDYQLLVEKVHWDNRLWGNLAKKSASEARVKSEFGNQTQQLKDWIEKRMEWLRLNLATL